MNSKQNIDLARSKLCRLSARGAEFLGVRHAILGGAMSWVSERRLVAATSNSGAFGVIATGSLTPEELREEVLVLIEKLH